jgi:hypothetical protein
MNNTKGIRLTLWNSAVEVLPSLKMTDTTAKRDKFTLFPRLQSEIRLMIWEEMWPEPRIIEVGYAKEDEAYESNNAAIEDGSPAPSDEGPVSENEMPVINEDAAPNVHHLPPWDDLAADNFPEVYLKLRPTCTLSKWLETLCQPRFGE